MICVRSCNDSAIILQVYAHHRPACVCGIDFSNMNMKRKQGLGFGFGEVTRCDDSPRRHRSAAPFSLHRQPSVDNASEEPWAGDVSICQVIDIGCDKFVAFGSLHKPLKESRESQQHIVLNDSPRCARKLTTPRIISHADSTVHFIPWLSLSSPTLCMCSVDICSKSKHRRRSPICVSTWPQIETSRSKTFRGRTFSG